MRICLVLEGSYPYVRGGVSSWAHSYIQAMEEHDFILWCISPEAKDKGNYQYDLPSNVKEVHEVFLDDAMRIPAPRRRQKQKMFTAEEMEEHKKIALGQSPDLDIFIELYNAKKMNINAFLMSDAFLKDVVEICRVNYPYVPMTELFHSLRSMLLPMLYMFSQEIPEADVYHSVSTGYAGILSAMAGAKSNKPFILTEHGIYTREREEEIIRADWISPYLKQQWIDFFYMLANISYSGASSVTSLFEQAKEAQKELGCPPEKLKVIRNGIHANRLTAIPIKEPDDFIDIGAIARFHPIKDIKTLIYAFYELKRTVKNARLHILGGIDDEEYYFECTELIGTLKLEDIFIPGVVNVLEYMEKLDFTVLSSISEGQPLSVLESFAARRPCVITHVGCCRELVEGTPEDPFGRSGYIVPPMHAEMMAKMMERLCNDRTMRLEMGENGRKRVQKYYVHEEMIQNYLTNYEEVLTSWQASVSI